MTFRPFPTTLSHPFAQGTDGTQYRGNKLVSPVSRLFAFDIAGNRYLPYPKISPTIVTLFLPPPASLTAYSGNSPLPNNFTTMARLAYSFSNQFPRHPQAPLDSKRRLADDDDDSVLDENILDCTTPEMSPGGRIQRKGSLADTTSTFSPRDNAWPEFAFSNDPATVQQPPSSSHLYMDQAGNQFVRAEVPHTSSYGDPSTAWHSNGNADSSTPTPGFEAFPSEYEMKAAQAYSSDAVVPAHPNAYGGLPMRSTFQPSNTLSTSPRSGQDWMSTSSSEHIELQSISKHARIESPTYHSNPPLLRRDGIRKKNARFEIPAERTLRTIDHLINQTSDEQEIKELKQQKRLLRNRQAA